ncbi:MAG: hypothetical protein LW704_06565, partial [Cryomorphaceae bacterium]|nr:hypothetical protein [Cryomorphaceae bacterium]
MRKYYLLTLLTMVCLTVSSQVTLYSTTFESSNTEWTFSGDLTPNTWIINTCAGNGPSTSGTKALYITKGGAVPGCGATGTEQYAYGNSTSGTNVAIASTTIDASCVSTIDVQFDYKIDGILGQDYLELVYSTNGGATWTATGGTMTTSNGWNYVFTNLPNTLLGTIFKLGFRFTYDNATLSGIPPAIDNLYVTGFDDQNPTITCPTPTTVYLNTSCQGSIPDYTTSVVWSDNCTTSSSLM